MKVESRVQTTSGQGKVGAATTARPRDWSRPVLLPGDLANEIHVSPGRYGLVFGPEDRGLTNEEISRCDEIVSVPLPRDPAATLGS